MRAPRNNARFVAAAVPLLLVACGGDDKPGASAPGRDGADGTNGAHALVLQTPLASGSMQCSKGGVLFDSGIDFDGNGTLEVEEINDSHYVCNPSLPDHNKAFKRISTFPVCLQSSCDSDLTTAAEIVAAADDGTTLIYSDSPAQQLGFVDITNPAAPKAKGVLALEGEPTSVAVLGDYALVALNTSSDYVDVSGQLVVVDIASQTVVHTIDLLGQPDAVAISPDKQFAAIAIENERDEGLDDGAPPQSPAGALAIISLAGAPEDWQLTILELSGLAELYGADPEPEYVDINSDNIAVVTLQENNHLVLVDLATASVLQHFSAGSARLTAIDMEEEEPALVSQNQNLLDVLREPDGVAWINNDFFVTADEGDLHGGSRGFTVFHRNGTVVFASGNELEHRTARLGHYPDNRSGNKGNEPENVEVGIYGSERFMFVASERSSLLFVYDAADPSRPLYKQTLPAAAAPEGVLALPARNLLITASEEDSRGDKMRSALNIYQYSGGSAIYPSIASVDRAEGTPIPWGALSGLTADWQSDTVIYAVDDSYYQRNRIFKLDISTTPAEIVEERFIRDSNGIFAAIDAADLEDATVADTHESRADVFDEADLAALINADQTVNIDPEGIAQAEDGGFWIASEGAGTVGDAAHPINSLNWLIKTDRSGVIEAVHTLPEELCATQLRFGFEGVTEYNGQVYTVLQRPWGDEEHVRIGAFDPATGSWTFYRYLLDHVASPAGGWVGLSELSSLGNGEFLVVERDNQAGPDAAVKRLYRFSLTDVEPNQLLSKTLVKDLMPEYSPTGGLVPEKIEGLALLNDDRLLIVNDNDGVDGSNGETQLLDLGKLAR